MVGSICRAAAAQMSRPLKRRRLSAQSASSAGDGWSGRYPIAALAVADHPQPGRRGLCLGNANPPPASWKSHITIHWC